MRPTFGFVYVGLCTLVLGTVSLVWAGLVLVCSWLLGRQTRRLAGRDPVRLRRDR